MIKTEELYNELRKYPQRIPNFNSNDLRAVLDHSGLVHDDLVRKLESKTLWLPSSEKMNPKTSDSWLQWYSETVESEASKYKHEWDIEIDYNGVHSDVELFRFHVWPYRDQEFDLMQKPVKTGNTLDVAKYLRENEGDYLVTDYFDTSYQKIKVTVDSEKAFIKLLKSHIPKKDSGSKDININPESKEKYFTQTFPKPFPEIKDYMNLPGEKITEIIKNHIQRVFESSGMPGVLSLRNEYEKDLQQIVQRMERNLPNDDKHHLRDCINYFNMFTDHINHMKTDLIRSGMGNESKKEIVQDSGSNVEKVINYAVKGLRKENKKTATKFMRIYSSLKKEHPGYNPTDFVKEINWAEPSANTQRDWMDKFDQGEKVLLKSD